MKNKIKRFFEPILVQPIYVFKVIFVQCFFSLYTIFNIFFIKYIIDIIEKGDTQNLSNNILIYVGVNLFYFTVTFFIRHWSWAATFYYHIKMVHQKYMNDFNSLDNTYVENIGTGKAISIISKGITKWTEMVIDVLSKPTKLIISIIAAFIIMQSIGLIYIFLFLILFIISHIVVYFLNKGAIKWRILRRDSMIEYDRQLVKMIMSKFEILQNNKIAKEIKVLDKYSNEAGIYNLKTNDYIYSMFSIPNIIYFILTTFILCYLTDGSISFGTIVSFFMILGLLKENITGSIEFFKDFTGDFCVIEKVWEFFDNGKKIDGIDVGKKFEYSSGNIEIKNLSFSYGNNKVFDDLSLKLEGGKKYAFVGISGSGKTTLIKLIAGFLSQNSGDIVVDNQNIADLNINSYYKHIGYLTQDPSVFDGSILENLTYGIDGDFYMGDDKLSQIIKQSKCEFIYNFKDGLNTQIGEKGVRLSGGQKQRLAIAKLFIKNPEIILLDEPTSALDSFNEEEVSVAFQNLFKDKTVIVVAHRLQTVKNSDKIFYLEKGKIVEMGNHEELLALKGKYYKMIELQSGF